MPRSKPTPTLAQLRRLAKMKGPYVVEWTRFRNAGDKPNNYPNLLMEVGQRLGNLGMKLLIEVFPQTRRQGQSMLFAALSALPDAKTKKEKR